MAARVTKARLQQVAELAHRWDSAVRSRLHELGVQRRASGTAVNETLEV